MKSITNNKLVIFGCSSFSNSIIALCNKIENIEVVAICVDDEYLLDLPETFSGLQVVGFNESLLLHPNASYAIAVGYKCMRTRKLIYDKLIKHNLNIATLISPNAHVDAIKIGSGCIIFDGVVIEQGAFIHDNVTIWSNVTICHDVEVDSHCFIAANSTLGGFVKVGTLTFIGFSATLIDSVEIGRECIIGACSLINSNVKDLSKYFGLPARHIANIDKNIGVSFP
ncbi:hypothetical protein [Shewanella sp. HL-SH2]|uniref:PglD-related sugar-binding protein n=1 Tax=Shewanella sp. HL-SH2 TaxID=3436238 RepID=UPI003EBAD1F5